MQIGLTQCAMWSTNPSVKEFLKLAGKAGYEVVELIVKASDDLTVRSSERELKKICRLASAANVKIISLALLHLSAAPIDSGEARETSVEEIIAGINLAQRMGASHVLLTLGWLTPELYYDEAYENGVQSLKEIAQTAEECGVIVAVEFVWNGFLFSPLEMRKFLEEIGSPNIGFYFDSGNMAVFQYPQHWVRILGKHLKLVHFKDWWGDALSGGWTPLLEGNVDFSAVMAELRTIDYRGPLIGEVEPFLSSLDKTAATISDIMKM